jgi:CBS-domain-containing membrane protein
MKVRDAMTVDVIAVGPEESIHKAARLMADHGVSGLPVVEADGRVVGIVSEGDLIVRQAANRERPWWGRFIDDADTLAREYQRATGTTVREVMTRAVVSVGPDVGLDAVGRILLDRRLRRLPVLQDGQLVGIISRGDLVKAFAATPPTVATASDQQLVRAMRARMAAESWAPLGVIVHAHEGIVTLWGLVPSEAERSALETMARAIPGCRGVENQLVTHVDIPYHYGA